MELHPRAGGTLRTFTGVSVAPIHWVRVRESTAGICPRRQRNQYINSRRVTPDIRDGVDAIMRNKCAHRPEKLLDWQGASHAERAPHREK